MKHFANDAELSKIRKQCLKIFIELVSENQALKVISIGVFVQNHTEIDINVLKLVLLVRVKKLDIFLSYFIS